MIILTIMTILIFTTNSEYQNYYKYLMLLLINSEKCDIVHQMSIVQKIRCRLSLQANPLKELNHVKVLFKLIEKHLMELETFSRDLRVPLIDGHIKLYLQANNRIKNHIIKKGQQIKLLAHDLKYEIDARLTLECFTKIGDGLNKIQQKIMKLDQFYAYQEFVVNMGIVNDQ